VKLKLDENLSARASSVLLEAGHDVSTVAQQKLQSATDANLIELCRRENRGLVTMDLDFANPLEYRPSQYPGLAVLRLPKKAAQADLLNALHTLAGGLKQNSMTGKLWIIEIGRIREFQEQV
jgi:predicted nuclease of predicted toxin-antitoxin system